MNSVEVGSYTGRDSDRRFPGLDGHPPLIIVGDTFTTMFHTDGSQADWGFKYTAVATIATTSTATVTHWIIREVSHLHLYSPQFPCDIIAISV